jgi:hypothetical protein
MRFKSRRDRGNGDKSAKRRPGNHRKLKVLTRYELDGRTTAAKQFAAIATSIAADLGGETELSTVQKHLVEAFAGVAIQVGDCNTRLLLGQEVDIVEHATAVSTLVRVAHRVGIERRAKLVPDLDSWLAQRDRDNKAKASTP